MSAPNRKIATFLTVTAGGALPMNIKPWLAGAAGLAAVTIGLATTSGATAASHPPAHAYRVSRASAPGLSVLRSALARAGRGTVSSNGLITNTGSAGYLAVADKNVQLRYASANFNIASLNCANSPTNGAGPGTYLQFTGLEGSDGSEELAGILATCTNGTTPTYQGWYQNGQQTELSSQAISSGDAIEASVYYNAGTNEYNFVVNDVTEDIPLFNFDAGCTTATTCLNQFALATSSVAANGSEDYPLADYGMENFTGGGVTSRDGVKGGYSSSKLWASDQLTLVDSSGHVMATSSALSGASAFSTTWVSAS
jgi:Peptidase A4 family